jgi:adenylylsulfate kinase
MKIILIMGLPGAGKTTLANKVVQLLYAKRLNADKDNLDKVMQVYFL